MLNLRAGSSSASSPTATEQQELLTRRRFLRRQRARRWLVWRRIILGLLLLAVVACGVWLVFFSPVLAVKGDRVSGTALLREAEVSLVAEVPRGVPLATVDLAAVEARVEGLAAVESAEASRAWPDRVHIEVTERQAVATVSWEGQWRGLDQAGVLFRNYPGRPTGLPEVNMRASTPIDVLAEAAAVVTSLPKELLGKVEFLHVRSIDSISLRLTTGATVNWGSAEESEDKAAVLAVLLDRKARVYDVTAPGRPTIRR